MSFSNIFSRKKEPPETKIKIIADNRERNSLVPAELAKLGCAITFAQLEVGDYHVANAIIERKTIADLQSSIMNKRIFSQLESMKKHPQSLLIIEGVYQDLYRGALHENAMRGFLLSLACIHKIPTVHTLSPKDTAQFILTLGKKKEKKENSLRASRVLQTDEERMQFILEGFPTIGPVTAKKLLTQFGSIRAILTAPDEELRKVLGKKTDEFLRLARHPYKD